MKLHKHETDLSRGIPLQTNLLKSAGAVGGLSSRLRLLFLSSRDSPGYFILRSLRSVDR
jgi:hypothetical protein